MKDAYLAGAIDLHVHIGPEAAPRFYDSIDLAREAAEAGMRAVVIKDHLAPSVQKAVLASKVVPAVSIFGGITLNHTQGGFSARAVLASVRAGAKYVKMPTVDSAYMAELAERGHWLKGLLVRDSFGQPVEGMSVFQDGGPELRPEVEKILRIVAEEDLLLDAGHLSPRECLALVGRARDLGVKKMSIPHPNILSDFTPEILLELVRLGAYLDLAYAGCYPLYGRQDPREIVATVRLVGAEHCNLVTDYGQPEGPSPVEGLRHFCHLLAKCGLRPDEIETMAKRNPATLLGLPQAPDPEGKP